MKIIAIFLRSSNAKTLEIRLNEKCNERKIFAAFRKLIGLNDDKALEKCFIFFGSV